MFSSALSNMLTQFPEFEGAIQALYQIDEEFRSLCEDYFDSKSSVEKYRNKAFMDRAAELEFKDLTEVLESEIVEYLKNRKEGNTNFNR